MPFWLLLCWNLRLCLWQFHCNVDYFCLLYFSFHCNVIFTATSRQCLKRFHSNVDCFRHLLRWDTETLSQKYHSTADYFSFSFYCRLLQLLILLQTTSTSHSTADYFSFSFYCRLLQLLILLQTTSTSYSTAMSSSLRPRDNVSNGFTVMSTDSAIFFFAGGFFFFLCLYSGTIN